MVAEANERRLTMTEDTVNFHAALGVLLEEFGDDLWVRIKYFREEAGREEYGDEESRLLADRLETAFIIVQKWWNANNPIESV
jgi:hypothetical protein